MSQQNLKRKYWQRLEKCIYKLRKKENKQSREEKLKCKFKVQETGHLEDFQELEQEVQEEEDQLP